MESCRVSPSRLPLAFLLLKSEDLNLTAGLKEGTENMPEKEEDEKATPLMASSSDCAQAAFWLHELSRAGQSA